MGMKNEKNSTLSDQFSKAMEAMNRYNRLKQVDQLKQVNKYISEEEKESIKDLKEELVKNENGEPPLKRKYKFEVMFHNTEKIFETKWYDTIKEAETEMYQWARRRGIDLKDEDKYTIYDWGQICGEEK